MTFLFHNNLVEFEGNNYRVKRLEISNHVELPNSPPNEDTLEIYDFSYRILKHYLKTSKKPEISFIYIDKTEEFLVNININYAKEPFELNLGILDKRYFKDISLKDEFDNLPKDIQDVYY